MDPTMQTDKIQDEFSNHMRKNNSNIKWREMAYFTRFVNNASGAVAGEPN